MVRTCLFNWAYARHTGGAFVFRIEDTDSARDSEESFDAILDSLTWLGLDWDEGVGKGGPHEPYRQSQRMDLYKEVAAELLAAGYLYESFSTPEEIEARHRAKGEPPQLGYDGYDRHLTEEQKEAFRAEGRRPVPAGRGSPRQPSPKSPAAARRAQNGRLITPDLIPAARSVVRHFNNIGRGFLVSHQLPAHHRPPPQTRGAPAHHDTRRDRQATCWAPPSGHHAHRQVRREMICGDG